MKRALFLFPSKALLSGADFSFSVTVFSFLQTQPTADDATQCHGVCSSQTPTLPEVNCAQSQENTDEVYRPLT